MRHFSLCEIFQDRVIKNATLTHVDDIYVNDGKECSFFSLKIINLENKDKNILEISDQNRIKIEVTFLIFSTNQLKTQNKNILENSDQKLISKKLFRLQNK